MSEIVNVSPSEQYPHTMPTDKTKRTKGIGNGVDSQNVSSRDTVWVRHLDQPDMSTRVEQ